EVPGVPDKIHQDQAAEVAGGQAQPGDEEQGTDCQGSEQPGPALAAVGVEGDQGEGDPAVRSGQQVDLPELNLGRRRAAGEPGGEGGEPAQVGDEKEVESRRNDPGPGLRRRRRQGSGMLRAFHLPLSLTKVHSTWRGGGLPSSRTDTCTVAVSPRTCGLPTTRTWRTR